MKKKKEEGFELSDLLELFVPKIWLIALIGILVAVVLGGYSQFVKKKTYTSDTSILMHKVNYSSVGDVDLIYKMVDSCVEVMYKDVFLSYVSDDIKTNYNRDISTGYLASVTDINVLQSAQVFEVVVTTQDAELSYIIAEAFARQAKESLSVLLNSSATSVEFKVVEYATRASAPNSKNVVRNTIVGFAIGVAIGLVVVFLHSALDVVVRDKKKLEDNFDIPVLGIIPDYEIDVAPKEACN